MKTSLLKFVFVLAAAAFLAGACNADRAAVNGPPTKAIIAGQIVRLELANTPEAQTRGLSGRVALPEDQGMLFPVNPAGKPTFWMKDMNFALDLIWIKGGKIAEISTNVPAQPGAADSELRLYSPQQEVDAVLEVNGGWAGRHQVKPGDPVDLVP